MKEMEDEERKRESWWLMFGCRCYFTCGHRNEKEEECLA
jgi:hypothetical protein